MKTARLLMPVVVILSLIGQAVPGSASEAAQMHGSAASASGNVITRQSTAAATLMPPAAPVYVPATSAAGSAICPDLAAFPNRIFLPLVMRAGGLLAAASVSQPQIPPDPGTLAPALDRSVATDIAEATAFLYSGSNPIQTGVAPNTIGARCVAVLRGTIQTRDGQPLAGVALTILNHPEYGQTVSRTDGAFDMAVNGGKPMTIAYAKDGYLPLQRTVATVLRDYAMVPTVVMIAPDSQVTTITPASGADFQVARGSVISDTDGQRQATLLFPQGVGTVITLTNGATQTLGTLNVRATEYTVGNQGAAAMPGDLPASSGYTYAVDLSVDEANSAGATGVRFDKPLINYTQNFIGAPVGSAVPAGYYDRAQGKWIGAKNGRVIKIVSKTGVIADVDITGDGVADTGAALTALGITDAERQRLATLYGVGQELWRVEITHFSPWDFNWPFGPPPGATAPRLKEVTWTDPSDPCIERGSVIGCETQTLGEDIPVTGTPFNLVYQSDRVPAWKAGQTLDIPVTAAVLPPLLKGVQLQIEVGGRQFERRWEDPTSPISSTTPYPPIVPNLSYHFEWDGLDAYGRLVQGRLTATIRVMYIYDFYYYKANDAFQSSFAQFAGNSQLFDGRASCRNITTRFFCGIPIEQTVTRSIGSWDAAAIDGLGAWTLDIHHGYDPNEQALHKGDGTIIRSESIGPVLSTLIGGGYKRFPAAEGGPALDAYLEFIVDAAVGPDGSLYVLEDSWNDGVAVRKVDPTGKITTVAGSGQDCVWPACDPTGDGGPAINAFLGREPRGIAAGPDGSIYFTVVGANYPAGYIRKINPKGIITTIAGINDRTAGNNGDGGPAKLAKVSAPIDVAVGPDGSIYFGERDTAINNWKSRVRRIDLNGIINTVAGGGTDATRDEDLGNGEPATQHDINLPYGLAFGPDGSLYITDPTEHIVTRVTPDGILKRFAGTRGTGHSGDGGLATQANIANPTNVAVSRDGTVYIRSDLSSNSRVRTVMPDGTISSYAGTDFYCNVISPDGESARRSCIGYTSRGLDFGPDGSVIVSDGNRFMLKFALPLGGFSADSFVVPSQDGSELYQLSSAGRHLRTLDALTGVQLFAFSYDSANRLASVTDGDGNVTRIERAAGGTPLAIVAPGGQRTVLTLNGNGYLGAIANPAGETTTLAYAAGGLLTTLTDPRGGVYRFSYDTDGRLVRDEDPSGGVKNLARIETTTGMTVTVTTGLGRATVYATGVISPGDRYRTVQMPSGAKTTLLTRADGVQLQTDPDGTRTTVALGPDPRWGMRAPIASSVIISMPNGLRHETTTVRTVTLSDKKNLMSLQTLAEQVTINGNLETTTYNAANRTLTFVSAEDRTGVSTLDALGRVVSEQAAGLSPANYTYDSRGRLVTATMGSGTQMRTVGFSYNSNGYLASITDPLNRTVSFSYDLAGRIMSQTLPDSRVIGSAYDANGNLTGLTPPNRPAHAFGYTPIDLLSQYMPPDVNPGSDNTQYAYNADRQLTMSTRPDGQTTSAAYDAAGRLNALTIARGMFGYTYEPTTGNLAAINAPGGLNLSYIYDGGLLKDKTWSGPVAGNVGYAYDNGFRVISITVNSGNAITFQYDGDSLVTRAGALTLNRNALNGMLTGSTLGSITDAWSYNDFAEPTNFSAAYNATPLYHITYDRDKLGRITQKTETLGGATTVYSYTYDLAGRLTMVLTNGVTSATYAYDSNGNRLSYTGLTGAISGAYDAQDRLLQYGTTTYGYTASGELLTKTDGAQTTNYQYDALGSLITVTLPDSTQIVYLMDGQKRRVGKKVNGIMTQALLYDDSLRPIAELDGSNNMVSRFVYATHVNVPDYLVKGSVSYRIIADHLGSPRLVVNAATGSIVQRMDYDEFGRVLNDTNPGFQPFGFAGGLYDRDTKLVRFGARDYDAETGRWTAKDPVLFEGGDVNLYGYVMNDPLNLLDPNGQIFNRVIGGHTVTGNGLLIELRIRNSRFRVTGSGMGAVILSNPLFWKLAEYVKDQLRGEDEGQDPLDNGGSNVCSVEINNLKQQRDLRVRAAKNVGIDPNRTWNAQEWQRVNGAIEHYRNSGRFRAPNEM
jgi:RHS repeat-associated protein